MRYVILGGGGVFGVQTALYLLSGMIETRRVVCVGRNPEKPAPFSLNVGRGDERYVYHQIHIVHEQDRLFDLLDHERPDVVINIAAQGEGAVSWGDGAWRFYETNAVALAKIVEGLLKRKFDGRWIQIGTSELYGSVDFPASEDMPIKCSSPYAVSKAAADMHLMAMHKVRGFPAIIIRPSNAYAPGQLLHRVIPRAVVCGLSGKKLPLNGGGMAQKSYIHARDLGAAIELIALNSVSGQVYNVGPGYPTKIRDVVELVARELNMSLEDLCDIMPARPGEDAVYWLDSSKAHALGWRQNISLQDGIKEMVDWGRQYLDQLLQYPQTYTLRV